MRRDTTRQPPPTGSNAGTTTTDGEPDATAAETGGNVPWTRYLRRAIAATLIGLFLYAGVYAWVERLVYLHGDQNSFFEVVVHDGSEAAVILGASHALPLKYHDMDESVERALGTPVVNLAMPGAGIVPNDLLMDAYLSKFGGESVAAVVYVLDSFAFYERDWNEERLEDDGLWERAPLDPSVAGSLWTATREYGLAPTILAKYLSGFTKVNGPSAWYARDVWDADAEFEETYSARDALDQERIDYLYPEELDEDVVDRYFGAFGRMIETLRERGIQLVVVRPPLRDAFRSRIPQEREFDARLEALLTRRDVALHDFSGVSYPPDHFFDPDHLNRTGAQRFLEERLAPALRPYVQPETGTPAE